MSARKKDPAIAAADHLQIALEAHSLAYDELDNAEARAQASGLDLRRPVVRVGHDDCVDLDDARRSAKGLPEAEAKKALQDMRSAVAEWQRRRRKAGLTSFDAAETHARRPWEDAMRAMGTTRATSVTGVLCKLHLIEIELRDGESGYGEAILASAMSDLVHISSKQSNSRRATR